jgi:hypothetical protein
MGGLRHQLLLSKLCLTDGWLRSAWDTAKTLSQLKINTISRPASPHRPTGISLALHSVGEEMGGGGGVSESRCDISSRCTGVVKQRFVLNRMSRSMTVWTYYTGRQLPVPGNTASFITDSCHVTRPSVIHRVINLLNLA